MTAITALTAVSVSCGNSAHEQQDKDFRYLIDEFADLKIMRYRIPGWDGLTLQQKEYVYHLGEAAKYGRDILWDQHCKYNLPVRKVLESILENYKGDRECGDFQDFTVYAKRVFFSNGIHHHYAEDKFFPDCPEEYFRMLMKESGCDMSSADLLLDVIYDPDLYPQRKSGDPDADIVAESAVNFYENVTREEVEKFYHDMADPSDETPVSYGLNSRLVKRDGRIYEETYKIGGRYSAALEKIAECLEKAKEYAENEEQKEIIETLVEFNRTGDLKTFDEYCIKWVEELSGTVDFICGFTEVYGDPLGLKGSWESSINFKNHETDIISKNAQWFEDNSPIDDRFKKEQVKGVSAKVITVAMLGGDCYPSTPIGINLPNADWIRRDHGSKSVTIENITEAYDVASQGTGFNDEFIPDAHTRKLVSEYGFVADNLHTDLHECLGHGSGKMLPGVESDALKSYSSTLEEARADLFALYYMGDKKILELGLLPDKEAYKAEYYKYMMNGLMTQLTRIRPGDNIEEAHMRNRQLIARWTMEKGAADKVVEIKEINGKRYVIVNDYKKLRNLFGNLLAEIQRIKSEGDYEAGKNLVENYAVKVDADLHNEVLERYKNLGIAPYKGFVNPRYTPVKDENGNITDVTVSYNEGYAEQMLRYSEEYSLLPTYND